MDSPRSDHTADPPPGPPGPPGRRRRRGRLTVAAVVFGIVALAALTIACLTGVRHDSGNSAVPPNGSPGSDLATIWIPLGSLVTGLISALAALVSALAAYRTSRYGAAPRDAAPAPADPGGTARIGRRAADRGDDLDNTLPEVSADP